MTISEEFRNNTRQYSRVTIELSGEVFDDTFYGTGAIRLDAEASSLEFNRLSDSRGTGTFTFVVNTERAAEVLDPISGCIIYPYSGVMIEDEIHWEPLGRYVIESSDSIRYPVTNTINVQVIDFSEKIRDNKWKAPFSAGGGTYNATIEQIMVSRANGLVPYRLYLATYATVAPVVTYTESDDPWAAIVGLARSAQAEAYFDKRGNLVVANVPDPATLTPVMILGGDDFRVEVGRRRTSVSRREVYNGVIVRGEAPWLLFPIRGEYWDTNPVSPTYRFGPFGEKPYVMGSPVATSDAQCAAIAETEYRLRAGVSEDVSFSMLKDPTLEVGSLIEMSAVGDEQKFYIMDAIRYPMGSGPMSATIRRRRL